MVKFTVCWQVFLLIHVIWLSVEQKEVNVQTAILLTINNYGFKIIFGIVIIIRKLCGMWFWGSFRR